MEQKKPAQERLGLLGQNVKGHLDIGVRTRKHLVKNFIVKRVKLRNVMMDNFDNFGFDENKICAMSKKLT